MPPSETFLALLYNGPVYKADALVVLCGEDAEPRIPMAAALMNGGGALNVVLSGGIDQPPRWKGARTLYGPMLGKGVPHEKVIVEGESQNTREQAVNVVALAKERDWKRLILIASAYHMPRAFLTFLKAVDDVGLGETLQLQPFVASQLAWGEAPDGMTETRLELAQVDARKISEYNGHVATFERGTDYLLWWETHS